MNKQEVSTASYRSCAMEASQPVTEAFTSTVASGARRNSIDASWWNHIHVFNVAADRVVFDLDWFRATAIAVEVERAALNALSSRQGSKAGRPPTHDWDGAKRHIDACIAKQGPFIETKLVVREIAEYFSRTAKNSPLDETIYAWLREHPQSEWVKLL